MAPKLSKKPQHPEKSTLSRVGQHHPNGADQKRLGYVHTLLQLATPEMKRVARKLNRVGPHAHARILDALATTGSFMSAPRLQQPRVYTKEVLERAWETLKHDHEWQAAHEYFGKLKNLGIVPATSDQQRFMAAFKEHVSRKGHQLCTKYQGTVFYLSVEDVATRAAHAKNMCAMFESLMKKPNQLGKLLNGWIWADEVTLEETPHPKGARS